MDVIAMHQAGYDNAIASLGTAFTEGQASLIKRFTKDVYLAYDSDGAGTTAALRAIGILRNLDMAQRIIKLTPYKDPDEFIKNLGVEAYDERVRNALTGRIFEIDNIVSDYDMNNPEEKTAFMKAAGQLLAGIEDSTERSNYIDSVAAKYMLSRDELKKIVSKAGMAAVTIESIPRETPVYQKEQDSPAEKNQKYLLTMMVNEPFLFDKLSDVISQEDFTEPVICEVAEMVFGQYRDSGQVNPAQILNQFEDTEAQEKVSGIFTKELDFDTTPSVLEKALTDLIIKIKSDNIDKIRKTRTDVSSIELAKKKADLKKLRVRI